MPGPERRRRVIADLLSRRRVRSQEELRALLADRGLDVTQATLSRDLRALDVRKSPAGYHLPDAPGPAPTPSSAPDPASDADPLRRALGAYLLDARVGEGLVVLRTAPGHAQPLALALDRDPPAGVLGTIAGDDTIFVAADPASADAAELADRLRTLAGFRQPSGPGADASHREVATA